MKKKIIPVALILTLAGSMMFTSCIGKFALTNKVLSWNNLSTNWCSSLSGSCLCMR